MPWAKPLRPSCYTGISWDEELVWQWLIILLPEAQKTTRLVEGALSGVTAFPANLSGTNSSHPLKPSGFRVKGCFRVDPT